MQINKRILAVLVFCGVLGLAVIGYLAYQHQSQGILDLTVVPQDAAVAIDSGKTVKPGSIPLSAGVHAISVSRDGFASQSFRVEITAGQHQSHEIALETSSNAGTDYLKNNPDEA